MASSAGKDVTACKAREKSRAAKSRFVVVLYLIRMFQNRLHEMFQPRKPFENRSEKKDCFGVKN